MATTDDLLREIVATRTILEEHIKTEEPIHVAARELAESHGTNEEVRARIEFVRHWMETSKDRAALRKAIIEKSAVAALWAILVFVALAIQHELRDIVVGWTNK